MTVFFGEPGKSALRYDAPIFQTPLGPILAFAAGLPLLGAAQGALDAWSAQTKRKLEEGSHGRPARRGREVLGRCPRRAHPRRSGPRPSRQVLKELMEQRYAATRETPLDLDVPHVPRHLHGPGRDGRPRDDHRGERSPLDNPIQRALRDIQTASNHA